MIYNFFNKIKRIVITMRFGILSIFISLFVFIIFTMMIISYLRFYSAISSVANDLMEKTSTIILREVSDEVQETELLSRFSSYLIKKKVVNTDRLTDIIDYTYHLVEADISYMQSSFWADEKGNFISSDEDSYNGPVTTDIISRNIAQPNEIFIHHNLQGKIIRTNKNNIVSYDPRVRPWYVAAKKQKKTIWTDVYRYHTNHYGVTVATPVYYDSGQLKGVFGLHIRLDYLNDFIKKINVSKNGLIYIVNNDGRVIVFPRYTKYNPVNLVNVHDIPIPWVVKSFDEYKKENKSSIKFRSDGVTYLAVYHLIQGFKSHDWLLGVVVPEADFVGSLQKTNIITVGISFILLILGIFLVSKLVSRLVVPLNKLTQEVERIKNFHLEETPHIQSRIKEVLYISNAVYAMKQGLRSFQKYVPSTLVRQLIETGEDARIGGVKKPITIFFSDIANFTSIAEKAEPVELTQHLCDYFSDLASIINSQRGTIDKYIGDSMMAFWVRRFTRRSPVSLQQLRHFCVSSV